MNKYNIGDTVFFLSVPGLDFLTMKPKAQKLSFKKATVVSYSVSAEGIQYKVVYDKEPDPKKTAVPPKTRCVAECELYSSAKALKTLKESLIKHYDAELTELLNKWNKEYEKIGYRGNLSLWRLTNNDDYRRAMLIADTLKCELQLIVNSDSASIVILPGEGK